MAWMLLAIIASNAFSDTVVLTSGDTLHGNIIKETDDAIELEHPVLGTLIVPRDKIESIEHTPPETTAKEVDSQIPAAGDADTTQAPKGTDSESAPPAAVAQSATVGTPAGIAATDSSLTAAEATEAQAIWKSQFQLGYGLTEGANNTTNFNVGINTTMTKGIQTLTASANYQYQSTNEETTQNRLETKVQSEWQAPDSRWIPSVQGFFDKAQFQAWDYRVIVNGDLGYEFIDQKRKAADGSEYTLLSATFKLGGGIRRELGTSDDEGIVPEGLIGLQAAWKPGKEQTLSFELTYYPDLLAIDQYRFIASGNYEIGLKDFENLSLIIGVHYEYDSHIAADDFPTYLRINVGLGLDF